MVQTREMNYVSNVPNIQQTDKGIISNLQGELQNALREITLLRQQNATLQKQFKELTQTQQTETLRGNSNYSPDNSDEEEQLVERETDWLLPKSRGNKKRKASESPAKDSSTIQISRTLTATKPPPIILSNVEDYNVVKEKLNPENLEYKTAMMSNQQIKINVSSADEYRKLTALINDTNLEWHTYENKSTRHIKVMVRNLHPSTSTEDIMNELKENNFKIMEVVQKFKKISNNNKAENVRLPLYMLMFEHTEDIQKIYNIQYINHMKVKIEAVRNNKLIPQCKKCQRYEHTQKFCNRTPACVKCAGNHLTSDCKKARDLPAKCINCTEAHPANYRGCTVAKELQKRRAIVTKAKKPVNYTKPVAQNTVQPGVTYAEQVQSKPAETQDSTSTAPSMMQLVQEMMKTLVRVNERLYILESRSTGAIPN